MEEVFTQIKELSQSLQILLKKYKHLQKENEHLKQLNKELSAVLLEKEGTVQSEQQKMAAKILADGYDVDEKKLLQQKIDIYLRDIERCLSLLNA